jgi:hypothetical protein
MLESASEQDPTGIVNQFIDAPSNCSTCANYLASLFACHHTESKVGNDEDDATKCKPFQRCKECEKLAQKYCEHAVDDILFLHIKTIVTIGLTH